MTGGFDDGTQTTNVDNGLLESILGKLSFINDVIRCCTNDACEIDDCCCSLNKPARQEEVVGGY